MSASTKRASARAESAPGFDDPPGSRPVLLLGVRARLPPHPPASFNNGPDALSRFFALFRGCHPPAGRPRDVVSRARSHLARVFAPRGVPPARHPRRLRARPPPRSLDKYLQISSNIYPRRPGPPRLCPSPVAHRLPPKTFPPLVHHRRPLRGVRRDEWASPRVVRVPRSRGRLRRHPRRRLSLAGLSDHFPVRPAPPVRLRSPPTTTSSSPRASRASSSSSPSSSTSTPRSGPRVDPDDDSTFGWRTSPPVAGATHLEIWRGRLVRLRPGVPGRYVLLRAPRARVDFHHPGVTLARAAPARCALPPQRVPATGVRSASKVTLVAADELMILCGVVMPSCGTAFEYASVLTMSMCCFAYVVTHSVLALADIARRVEMERTDSARLRASRRSRWWRGRRIPRCICSRTRVW